MAKDRSTGTKSETVPRSRTRGRRAANGGEQLRHAELLQIASDLFADRGYAATTVRDIADAAGILSGSLYHHFSSKESMIDEILSGFIEKTLAKYDAIVAEGLNPRATFERLVHASLGAMVEDRSAILIYQNEVRFLLQEPRFSYLREAHLRFERIWTGVLARGVEAGEFRDSIDPNLIYRLVRDTVWTPPRWWRPGGSVKPDRIVEQYLAVLVDGIAVHA
jgi:TetR/AcrR family transcriptional regulator, cholesterol catabolism regulator